MIPQSVLDQIQDRCDIVDVVSQYVPLRKMGRNFKCPCPFHNEKTPSFVVSQEKQIFHCFGCGVGGNVFSFLIKYEKLDFREAAQRLAERAGVDIPEDESVRQKRSDQEPLYEANRLASEFYVSGLEKASRDLEVWRYLTKRGLTPEALSKFGIGYSTDRWDGFIKFAGNRYSESLLVRNRRARI